MPASALHLVPGDGKVGAALVADRARRRRRLHRLDRGRARDQPRARRQGRADRAADRRDRRHQRHDRRCHRAARAGRPTTWSTSAFRSAGQRCSALRLLCVQEDVADRMHRDDRGRGARAAARRSARSRDPCRAGDRRRGASSKLDALDRRHGGAGARALPLGRRAALPATRHLSCAPAIIALDRARDLTRGGVRPGAACGALARRRARSRCSTTSPRNGYGLTLGIHSRIDATAERIAARLAARQCLRQPQHDRRGGRHPAVRRQRAFRHRPEGGRPELSCGASRSSRSSRSTPRPPAATPALLSERGLSAACAASHAARTIC